MQQGDLFSTTIPIHQPSNAPAPNYNERFQQAYESLNKEQKQAVDTIEGPVLVAAGPGTGKTQILAMRVGKILLEQDVAPHNILCLTFTDAGVAAMRNRLLRLIGPTAHQVHINSFHGFCNQIIQENLDIFGSYKQFQPISELETIDIYRSLIDQLPEDNSLRRYKYDKYTDLKRIKHLFDLMKKENFSPKDIADAVDDYIDRQDFTYKRKTPNKKTGKVYEKGDLNEKKYNEAIYKYSKLKDAANQYPLFMRLMQQNERYDYNDMLLWVLREFETRPQLLADYQERYLYFLVDEYQDTNGAQNKLLENLLGDYGQPNVFVVGDDDQAIFKFQGANLGNILNFQEKYKPELIVLQYNYRSTQPILDGSKTLISHNKERLLDKMDDLTKDLVAAGAYKSSAIPIRLLNFVKTSEEYAYIVKDLKGIYDRTPNKLKEVAVIYRAHRQAADLVTVLEKLDIPVNIKRKVDILTQPLIINLLEILGYISDELNRYGSGQHRLFRLLHYSYFNIDPLDLGKLAHHLTKRRHSEKEQAQAEDIVDTPKEEKTLWRELISEKETLENLSLNNASIILEVADKLNRWMTAVSTLTLQNAFQLIIDDSGILESIIAGDNRAWELQVLGTFFDFIKNESVKNPTLDIKALVQMAKKMKEEYIQLPINKVTSSDQGVNFLTAHAAKGLEFEEVYLLGCTKGTWDKSAGGGYGQFSYPDNINADSKTNIEDERRLFYVAMTRAKKQLTITYADRNEKDKELQQSQFISEALSMEELNEDAIAVNPEDTLKFHYNLLKRKQITLPLIDKNLIDNWLKGYKLSVTHLNKFLRCPVTFYFEAILRVPGARNAATGFGSAMHDTLHAFFNNIRDPKTQTIDWLQFLYKERLTYYRSNFTDEEYEDYLVYGQKVLKDYHTEKIEEWLDIPDYKLEIELSNAVYKGVPLKGVIDKVEVYKDHANVVDYKTGSHKREKLKDNNSDAEGIGGDYWRQLVFYKILLSSDNKYNINMVEGRIDYIEPDKKSKKFHKEAVNVTAEDIEHVGRQIVDMYDAVHAYKFDTTCEDKECRWCNFATEHYKTQLQ
jgi:DNA helicase-2/ATP-dependent DNA helicase PcrA